MYKWASASETPPYGGVVFLYRYRFHCLLYLLKIAFRYHTKFSQKPLTTQDTDLRKNKIIFFVTPRNFIEKLSLFRSTCLRHRKKKVFVEFFQDKNRSLVIIVLPILFKSDIDTKRTPPEFPLIKIRDMFIRNVIQKLLLFTPTQKIFSHNFNNTPSRSPSPS